MSEVSKSFSYTLISHENIQTLFSSNHRECREILKYMRVNNIPVVKYKNIGGGGGGEGLYDPCG